MIKKIHWKRTFWSLFSFCSHRLSRWEDGVVVGWLRRPWLTLTAGNKRRWGVTPLRPACLPLDFAHLSSAIGVRLADGIGEPFLEGADRVPRPPRWRVGAGEGAPWAMAGHVARRLGDTGLAAGHRVRLCQEDTHRDSGLENSNYGVHPLGSDTADGFLHKHLVQFPVLSPLLQLHLLNHSEHKNRSALNGSLIELCKI